MADEKAVPRTEQEATVRRLERTVASMVAQLRAMADTIEREAANDIESASESRHEWSSYSRVAERAVHILTWGMANTNLSNVVDAASDADRVRQEKSA